MNGTLLTITGPTCSGKTTLQKLLVDGEGFNPIVSFTTRAPRQGEVDGKDYWFITDKELETLAEEGGIAEEITFGQYEYGILTEELITKLQKGDCAVVVEPNGVIQLAKFCKDYHIFHRSVFITNNPIVLTGRFLKRFKEDEQAKTLDYARRLISMIQEEQDWIFRFNYDKIYTCFDKTNELDVVEELTDSEFLYGSAAYNMARMLDGA